MKSAAVLIARRVKSSTSALALAVLVIAALGALAWLAPVPRPAHYLLAFAAILPTVPIGVWARSIRAARRD